MAPSFIDLELPFKPPLDWESMIGFLAARAVGGVELVEKGCFKRSVRLGQATGTIEVSRLGARSVLVRVSSALSGELTQVADRVRRVFDLDADPACIAADLARDRRMAKLVRAHPGLRVPGAWDGFEIAVRAIVGQQVSVRAATTVCGRIAEAYGESIGSRYGNNGLRLLFPSPERLSRERFEKIGLTSKRIEALRRLAQEVHHGALSFSKTGNLQQIVSRLTDLPGIGPWTANYIAMRAFSEADAFPSSDLVLRRAAAGKEGELLTERELLQRAERWRPWRAYATLYVWTSYANRSK